MTKPEPLPDEMKASDESINTMMKFLAICNLTVTAQKDKELVRRSQAMIASEHGRFLLLQITAEVYSNRLLIQHTHDRIRSTTKTRTVAEDLVRLAVDQGWICATCNLPLLAAEIDRTINRCLEVYREAMERVTP